MKKLNAAVAAYRDALRIQFTRPKIVFIWGVGFICTLYYSRELIERHRWLLIKEPPLVFARPIN